MILRIKLLPMICLATLLLSAVDAPAEAADVVHFTSAVPPPSALQLRQAQAQGKKLKQEPGFPLWGHLSKPDGAGPFPAVVLMHGCNGIHVSHGRWASQLNELGYVTLILDSFRPRSLFNVCSTPTWSASPAMRVFDAHGALAYLQGLPFVDPTRIGVIGWSHGGISALGAVARFGVADRLPGRFTMAIAFYPYCISDRRFDLPVLILMGDADDWTPIGPCRKLHARNSDDSGSVELIAYAGAHHGFDVLELKDGFSVKGVDGRAHWLEYDRPAHEDAMERVGSFLARHLSR